METCCPTAVNAWEDGMLLFICEFVGEHEAVCPRGTLRRILEKADRMGYQVLAGVEYEFFLFEETPDTVREKNYKNLKPIQPGFFGYSMIRNTVDSDLYQDLLDGCLKMDMALEALHEETGPGCIEAAIQVDSALHAADKAALFKTFTKVMAQKNGLMATFMAKWSNDFPGQSGHIHISLRHQSDGTSAFYNKSAKHGMSDLQRHFLAGQQKFMPELCAMYSQTVNAYSRMVPGFWAPTDATWGVENRTTAL
ncbi:MAG: glutamine synthetase, partial [Hyphomicrobiales bacterium]